MNDLGKDKIGKLLINMSLPAIMAQLINGLYNIIDRMFIGHIPNIGATALTGVGLNFPIIMLVSAFSALICMGGAPKASIHMGKGDNDSAEKILGSCTCTLTLVSVVITALLLVFAKPVLYLFGASDATIVYAYSYLTIYACGTIFVQITLGLNAFINAQGFAKIGMSTILIGAVINTVLDPIFIFVFNMGVKGAAYATVISQAVSAIWVLVFLRGSKTKLRIKRKYFKVSPKIMFPVMALGLAPFIMQSTESLISVCFNVSLRKFGGDIAIGAMTILSSIMQFAMMPLSGLTQGASPIISFNYGAGNIERVKKTFKTLITFSLTYSVLIWALSMFAPQVLVSVFTADTVLSEFTVWALRVYMASMLFFGAQIACQQTFVALGQAGASMFLATLRKIILLIPLIFLFPMFFENKVFAVFLAEPVADFLAVATTVTLFAFRINKILAKKAK